MKLSAADEASYPHFANYVKRSLPKLITIPKIVAAVARYGALDRAAFQRAISWGVGPNIIITDLHAGQCGVPRAYGCFRQARPSNIEIHVGTVRDFEVSAKADRNLAGNAVYVVGASLLHELCHWGNFNHVPTMPELREMGAAFELAVYGKVIY